MPTLHDLIQQFVDQLSDAIESQAMARAREAVESALGVHALSGRRNGHANGSNGAGAALRSLSSLGKRPRKKAPIQLCPVPGCSERAAPVFGMVCAKHKDLPKAKIKKYREARRAQKLKTKGKGPTARRPRAASKKRVARKKATAKRSAASKRTAAPRRNSTPAPAPAAAAS